MKTAIPVVVVVLLITGCGRVDEPIVEGDDVASLGDELSSQPNPSCANKNEQQCLAKASCEAEYGPAVCPMIYPPPPSCGQKVFVACRPRCTGLSETACRNRSDCQALYSGNTPCPLCPVSQNGTGCPPCPPPGPITYQGCTFASPPGGGGGTIGGGGSTGGGAPPSP